MPKSITEFHVKQNGELIGTAEVESEAYLIVACALTKGNKVKHFEVIRFIFTENGTFSHTLLTLLATGKDYEGA